MDIAIIIAIVIVSGYCLVRLGDDLWRKRDTLSQEPGRPLLQAISSTILYFFNAFGISDFALSAILYPRAGWLTEKQLPGTLNTQSVLPVTILAISYIIGVDVALSTLLPFLILQGLGSWLGPRFCVRLRPRTIQLLLAISLCIAGVFIFINKAGLLAIGGQATGLVGWRLVVLSVASFLFGICKTMGIGAYPLTMALTFFLGLNPLVAYPLMMGSGAFSVSIASLQFIKLDAYARRITLFSNLCGGLAALVAVFFVKSLDIGLLQWILAFVILFAAADMWRKWYQTRPRA